MTLRMEFERHAEAGFTLVELLIAMTLLGLLMVVVLGGLRFGARAWERNEAHTTATDDVRQAQTLLRREISRAYPYFIMKQEDLPNRHVDFQGGDDEMSFLAPAPAVLGGAGRARVTFRQADVGGRQGLVMSAAPELATGTQPASEVLLQGVKAVSFAYFGSDEPGGPSSWHDSWKQVKWMPQLIRITAEFEAGDERMWPELLVAPRISVDVSCTYDPLTKYCAGRRW